MTHRLYHADAYLTRFPAQVVDRDATGTRIYLDQTAFYPTSGGQLHDRGYLGGIAIVDVIDEEERIAHVLESPLTVAQVEGVVDWNRRFDHMQQHTAQHLLTAVIARMSRRPTVSVHFGEGSSTVDLEGPAIGPDEAREIERAVNHEIVTSRPVAVSYEDASVATGLRKASDRSGTLRIVTIDDLDRSACGGTHVRHTGEIGALLLRKIEKVKLGTRIEFLAGGRAIQAARADFERLNGMAVQASTALEEVPALFERLRADLKQADATRRGLDTELYGYRARDLYHATTPGADGIRAVAVQGESVDGLRGLGQALLALPQALFVGTLEAPPTIVVATSADSGLDANLQLKSSLAAVGGRGGGNARLAQGTVPNREMLATMVREVTIRRPPG